MDKINFEWELSFPVEWFLLFPWAKVFLWLILLAVGLLLTAVVTASLFAWFLSLLGEFFPSSAWLWRSLRPIYKPPRRRWAWPRLRYLRKLLKAALNLLLIRLGYGFLSNPGVGCYAILYFFYALFLLSWAYFSAMAVPVSCPLLEVSPLPEEPGPKPEPKLELPPQSGITYPLNDFFFRFLYRPGGASMPLIQHYHPMTIPKPFMNSPEALGDLIPKVRPSSGSSLVAEVQSWFVEEKPRSGIWNYKENPEGFSKYIYLHPSGSSLASETKFWVKLLMSPLKFVASPVESPLSQLESLITHLESLITPLRYPGSSSEGVLDSLGTELRNPGSSSAVVLDSLGTELRSLGTQLRSLMFRLQHPGPSPMECLRIQMGSPLPSLYFPRLSPEAEQHLLSAHLESLSTRLEPLNTRLEPLNTRLESLRILIASPEYPSEFLASSVDFLQSRLEFLGIELQSLKAQMALQSVRAEEAMALQSQLESLKTRMSSSLDSVESRLESYLQSTVSLASSQDIAPRLESYLQFADSPQVSPQSRWESWLQYTESRLESWLQYTESRLESYLQSTDSPEVSALSLSRLESWLQSSVSLTPEVSAPSLSRLESWLQSSQSPEASPRSALKFAVRFAEFQLESWLWSSVEFTASSMQSAESRLESWLQSFSPSSPSPQKSLIDSWLQFAKSPEATPQSWLQSLKTQREMESVASPVEVNSRSWLETWLQSSAHSPEASSDDTWVDTWVNTWLESGSSSPEASPRSPSPLESVALPSPVKSVALPSAEPQSPLTFVPSERLESSPFQRILPQLYDFSLHHLRQQTIPMEKIMALASAFSEFTVEMPPYRSCFVFDFEEISRFRKALSIVPMKMIEVELLGEEVPLSLGFDPLTPVQKISRIYELAGGKSFCLEGYRQGLLWRNITPQINELNSTERGVYLENLVANVVAEQQNISQTLEDYFHQNDIFYAKHMKKVPTEAFALDNLNTLNTRLYQDYNLWNRTLKEQINYIEKVFSKGDDSYMTAMIDGFLDLSKKSQIEIQEELQQVRMLDQANQGPEALQGKYYVSVATYHNLHEIKNLSLILEDFCILAHSSHIPWELDSFFLLDKEWTQILHTLNTAPRVSIPPLELQRVETSEVETEVPLFHLREWKITNPPIEKITKIYEGPQGESFRVEGYRQGLLWRHMTPQSKELTATERALYIKEQVNAYEYQKQTRPHQLSPYLRQSLLDRIVQEKPSVELLEQYDALGYPQGASCEILYRKATALVANDLTLLKTALLKQSLAGELSGNPQLAQLLLEVNFENRRGFEIFQHFLDHGPTYHRPWLQMIEKQGPGLLLEKARFVHFTLEDLLSSYNL